MAGISRVVFEFPPNWMSPEMRIEEKITTKKRKNSMCLSRFKFGAETCAKFVAIAYLVGFAFALSQMHASDDDARVGIVRI
jgi:hypothetical protein